MYSCVPYETGLLYSLFTKQLCTYEHQMTDDTSLKVFEYWDFDTNIKKHMTNMTVVVYFSFLCSISVLSDLVLMKRYACTTSVIYCMVTSC